MDSVIFIYSTTKNQQSAESISKALISEKLIACVNILAPIQSFYEWDGNLQNETEIPMVFKTKSSLYKSVEKRLLELHPYETPCIVSFPIEQGQKDFLRWINLNTKSPEQIETATK